LKLKVHIILEDVDTLVQLQWDWPF